MTPAAELLIDTLMFSAVLLDLGALWVRLEWRHRPEAFASLAICAGAVLLVSAWPVHTLTVIFFPWRLMGWFKSILRRWWKADEEARNVEVTRHLIESLKDHK